MGSPLRRIILAFVVIVLLPVGFVVYELSSLNNNEEIVREIYRNQLDAILYSVNQYSDDVVSNWANRVTLELQDGKTISPDDTAVVNGLLSAVDKFSAVDYLYISDPNRNSTVYGGQGGELAHKIKEGLDKIVWDHETEFHRLVEYHQAGFKKMQAVDTAIIAHHLPVFFVMERNNQYYLGAFVIDLSVFIESILGPKMQAVSQGQFVIAAFSRKNDSLVYSTESINPGSQVRPSDLSSKEGQQKSFWILPGYYLGIALRGATIDDLVRDRVSTSLFILSLVSLLLVAGIIFLYLNIRRQINLSQAKSEFVSNVSHEIRTPLSLISMYAETLEMDRVPEEKKKSYYAIIGKETARLSGIVNRILNFSQIESNKKHYLMKPVQLNDLCNEIINSYELNLRERGFAFEFVPDVDLPLIMGDRESISEAIINLIDNAIKYSPDKKHITVQTGSEGHYSFISVADEGIGIAKNHQRDIFVQFFRAPTGDIHNTKGSGLGLTLVKKTMDVHHGKIKVESYPGKGSTFRLYFPHKNDTVS
jgi:two-component system phosphate regulon sensor histidine kinase PhoR